MKVEMLFFHRLSKAVAFAAAPKEYS